LQPYRTQLDAGKLLQIPDTSLLSLGQSFDVHAISPEKISVALKYEGFSHCWIFSNESYTQEVPWENPEWQLGLGEYYLAVCLHYESPFTEPQRTWWLRLRNGGTTFDKWGIEQVQKTPFST
jgi:hypothetical protein